MRNTEKEIEELKTLQHEADELRTKRRQASHDARAQDDNKPAASELAQAAEHLLDKAIEAGQQLEDDADNAIHNLAARIETAAAELEEATHKRPIVALLAAVTVGIVIGQLFSRR